MRKVEWNYIRTFDVEFALILDPVIWEKTLKDMGIQGRQDFPSTAGCTTTFGSHVAPKRAIVTLRERPGLHGIQVAAVLAHEAMHVVQFIENLVQEEKFSPEAEAYLLQHVLQDLMNDYVTLKKEKKHVRSG